VLCASLVTAPALAQDADDAPRATLFGTFHWNDSVEPDRWQPTADDFRLDTHQEFHLQPGLRSDPRIQSSERGERIYLGDKLLPGKSARESGKQSGDLYLDFNQRGAEFVFRF
jgi:hypothetical protein